MLLSKAIVDFNNCCQRQAVASSARRGSALIRRSDCLKPLIGITTNLIQDDKFGVEAHIGGPGQHWHALADDYVKAVCQAGGIPVLLPILPDTQTAAEYLDSLDGILFSGGCDVSPLRYGENTTGSVGEICTERDEQELILIRAALEKPGFPILGICRGCQLLNVALGGTLVLDIDVDRLGHHMLAQQRMSAFTHTIKPAENTLISDLLDGEARVNSYHHQCVDHPGDGIRMSAVDPHGVPEAIELPQREGFTLGVQWHPEGLIGYEGHQRLFAAFIRAAAEKKESMT